MSAGFHDAGCGSTPAGPAGKWTVFWMLWQIIFPAIRSNLGPEAHFLFRDNRKPVASPITRVPSLSSVEGDMEAEWPGRVIAPPDDLRLRGDTFAFFQHMVETSKL